MYVSKYIQYICSVEKYLISNSIPCYELVVENDRSYVKMFKKDHEDTAGYLFRAYSFPLTRTSMRTIRNGQIHNCVLIHTKLILLTSKYQ